MSEFQYHEFQAIRTYCRGGSATTRARGGEVVLTFVSETDEGDELCETEGRLSSMISIRSELARGTNARCISAGCSASSRADWAMTMSSRRFRPGSEV